MMGSHDDCNDLERKFEKNYTCKNNKVILEDNADIRCDCPVIDEENAFGTNCKLNRNTFWNDRNVIIFIGILSLIIILSLGFIIKCFCFANDIDTIEVDAETL